MSIWNAPQQWNGHCQMKAFMEATAGRTQCQQHAENPCYTQKLVVAPVHFVLPGYHFASTTEDCLLHYI